MKKRIYLSSPHMGQNEQKYVTEAFDSNWVAPVGPNIDRFEATLAAYCQVQSAAGLTSGTAAIHLGLKILGVAEEDHVICQSLTFCGSANPIIYQGATPVFVDSESKTWNMDPQALEDAIISLQKRGKRIKAIIPVHLYGMPAQMEDIMQISERYDIPVLEDAAEGLGASIGTAKCGSFGTMSVLSFNGNKIITTSGGGALLSNDSAHIKEAKFLATQAREPAAHYEHEVVGYNYRLSNILAGIGIGQMEVLDDRVTARREVFELYGRYFLEKEAKGYKIDLLQEPEGFFSNRWLSCVLIDPNKNKGIGPEKIRLSLEEKNIESRPIWKPMHQQPLYRDAAYFGGAVSDNLFEKGLCLPSGSNMSDADKDRIFEALDSIFV